MFWCNRRRSNRGFVAADMAARECEYGISEVCNWKFLSITVANVFNQKSYFPSLISTRGRSSPVNGVEKLNSENFWPPLFSWRNFALTRRGFLVRLFLYRLSGFRNSKFRYCAGAWCFSKFQNSPPQSTCFGAIVGPLIGTSSRQTWPLRSANM